MPDQRRLVPACTALLLCLASTAAWSAGRTVSGDIGDGVIPDNSDTGLTIPFVVDGLARDVRSVELRLQLAHTYVGDIEAVLVSPDGRARMTVFSRVGTNTSNVFGDSSNVIGDYRFADSATADFWSAAIAAQTDSDVIPPGTYRASAAGAPSRSENGGCPTSLAGVFGGLVPAQANGTWTLTLHDRGFGDSGTISLAELTIGDTEPVLFADGFEVAPSARPAGNVAASRCVNKVVADFTGDGLTDFVLLRPTIDDDILWSVRENRRRGDATPEAEAVLFTHGRAGIDLVDSMDYDGDRIADAMTWNAATGTFRIRRSSRTLDRVVSIVFGPELADVRHAGDYDGDGRDDLALFLTRASDEPAGPMTLLIRSSATGAIRSLALGDGRDGTAFVIGGFDLNGDGLADVSVQEVDPDNPQSARFRLINGRTGNLMAQFELGTFNDYILPGNYVGDPRFDTIVRRRDAATELRYHRTRDSFDGFTSPDEVQFGMSGDFSLGGDYDGDGLTDYAVYRRSATPGESRFIFRSSIDTAAQWAIGGGSENPPPGDYPVAASRAR